MVSCFTGADLEHIAAVLADPNPSSGQLQGRRIPKQAKKRPQRPPSRANEDDEAAPSGLPMSRKAARKSQAGSRLPQIPEQSPFDPKGKGRQQLPTPVASPRQEHLHACTPSRDSEGEAWQWSNPQNQRRHDSSEAGPPMVAPSLGQLHLDSDEEKEGPSQGGNEPRSSSHAGSSSSAVSTAMHGGWRIKQPCKVKARRRAQRPGTHLVYDRPGEGETGEASPCFTCLV